MGVINILEDLLKYLGIEDWELIYVPDLEGYILKLNGDMIYMFNAKEEEKDNEETFQFNL